MRELIKHATTHHIADQRFAALSCSGMGLTLTLPHGDVPLFHEWVRTLGDAKVNARRTIGQPGQLEATGVVDAGPRVSVLVELDRRLLVDGKLLGRVELDRIERFALALEGKSA
ncbi:hypothetical protein [Amycolatopsis solani]|uniref:hypothetical protein n=1 Tax=Amycolatopsis solani TaxID=3028615 RepID=UPI0025B0C1A3|nr:hypothetical protein [Amycolatopsis sp. MEP2-6]